MRFVVATLPDVKFNLGRDLHLVKAFALYGTEALLFSPTYCGVEPLLDGRLQLHADGGSNRITRLRVHGLVLRGGPHEHAERPGDRGALIRRQVTAAGLLRPNDERGQP